MAKLKLYYHSEESQKELLEDINNSIAELENMGEISAISWGDKGSKNYQYIKDSYSNDLKALLNEGLGYRYAYDSFEKFSKFIDNKYVALDKVDAN